MLNKVIILIKKYKGEKVNILFARLKLLLEVRRLRKISRANQKPKTINMAWKKNNISCGINGNRCLMCFSPSVTGKVLIPNGFNMTSDNPQVSRER